MEQIELIDIKKKLPSIQSEANSITTSQKGDYAEQLVITRLLKEGYTIAHPYGSQRFWDLLVEVNGHWEKWQIKTGCFNKVRLKTRNYYQMKYCHLVRAIGSKKRKLPHQAFDTLIVVYTETMEMFKIPWSDIPTSQVIPLNTDKYKW